MLIFPYPNDVVEAVQSQQPSVFDTFDQKRSMSVTTSRMDGFS